jgi:hypothetical protein
MNHSFWGVHIAGRKQSFTSWSVHITGRNWAFPSAVEKLSRHCPGTEYQHKQEHTSNMLCRIQKNHCCQRCIKICRDITLQQGEQQWHQMSRQTLGDFHINLQLPPSQSDNHSFNRELSKKLSNNSALHRLSCLNHQGRLVRPSSMHWQLRDLLWSFGTSPISLTLSCWAKRCCYAQYLMIAWHHIGARGANM